MARSLYEILGVEPTADEAQLRAALARIERARRNSLSPDSQEALKVAREAFSILSIPGKRASYDCKLAQRAAGAEAGRGSWLPLPPLPPGDFFKGNPLQELWAEARSKHPDAVESLRKPSPLVAGLALLGVFLLWNGEHQKFQRLEAKLESAEQALLHAAKEKDKELSMREAALLNAQKDFDQQQGELENRRLDLEQGSIEGFQKLLSRQIETQADIANRELDIFAQNLQANAKKTEAEADKTRAEIQIVNLQAQRMELDNRAARYAHDMQLADDYAANARTARELELIRELKRPGNELIPRSSPSYPRRFHY